MQYRYQVILLGTLNERTDGIINLFFQEIENLKLPVNFYKIILKNEIEKEYLGNQPTYVLYFGNTEGKHEDIDALENLLKDGNTILPIFYNSFSREIPTLLENQNGLRYDSSKDIKIVNLILESFGRLRSTRKVFVSYKRDQSTSVAIQLY